MRPEPMHSSKPTGSMCPTMKSRSSRTIIDGIKNVLCLAMGTNLLWASSSRNQGTLRSSNPWAPNSAPWAVQAMVAEVDLQDSEVPRLVAPTSLRCLRKN
jgi:hypothetical protein